MGLEQLREIESSDFSQAEGEPMFHRAMDSGEAWFGLPRSQMIFDLYNENIFFLFFAFLIKFKRFRELPSSFCHF